MRCPEDWDPATVAKWRALEGRFLCDDCEALVAAYADTVLADYQFAEDAIGAAEFGSSGGSDV